MATQLRTVMSTQLCSGIHVTYLIVTFEVLLRRDINRT